MYRFKISLLVQRCGMAPHPNPPYPWEERFLWPSRRWGEVGAWTPFLSFGQRLPHLYHRTSDIRLPGTVSPSITWTTSSGVTGIAVTGVPRHSLRDTDVLAHSFLLSPGSHPGQALALPHQRGDGRRRMKRKEPGREKAGMAIAGICVSQTGSFAPSPLRGRGGISSDSTRRKTGEARRRNGRRRR